MQLNDRLRALRGDDSPQRKAQAALIKTRDDWLAQPHVAEVMADMAAFGTSRPLAECPALAGLFDDEGMAACHFVGGFVRATAQILAREPLGHVALRHFCDPSKATLLLAQAGRVSLSLVVQDGAGLNRQVSAQSASFSPNEQWDHVLAGCGRGEMIERRLSAGSDQGTIRRRDITLSVGRVLSRDCARTALQLHQIDGRLVMLRLQRRQLTGQPTRVYDLQSGALIHQAASDQRDSRYELMLPLLRRMGRSDAAPLVAQLALEPGSDALRWQALSECLGLDTLTGFRTLTSLGQRADDPLAGKAAALRAQLIAAHPQLAEIV